MTENKILKQGFVMSEATYKATCIWYKALLPRKGGGKKGRRQKTWGTLSSTKPVHKRRVSTIHSNWQSKGMGQRTSEE